MGANTLEQTIERIRQERAETQNETPEQLVERVRIGEIASATAQVVHRTSAERREAVLAMVEKPLVELVSAGSDETRRSVLAFYTKLALDLGSVLPAWSDGPEVDVSRPARLACSALESLEKRVPDVAAELHFATKLEVAARLRAEAVSDESDVARFTRELTGARLTDYVEAMWDEMGSSNMRHVTESKLAGASATTLGNDYAAFLEHALRLGASSETTNPVLIKMAWELDRAGWDDKIDNIISATFEKDQLRGLVEGSESERVVAVHRINTLITIAVVEENCRLLRDLFLITEGREGYVNLQVNPENYHDADTMVKEAEDVYAELERRLGGVPNVVIKLPSTPAGKEGAARLTAQGIGVTMTLTFSMFQAIEVAEAMRDATALVSNIAIMNGRLANPVRDELVADGVQGGAEAARWSGVAVARKIFRKLYGTGGLGIDNDRIRLLVASLRIYDDWLPDITELWNVPAITIFPNVRRAFDARPRPFDARSIEKETPAEALQTLFSSEIFRQAYWWSSDNESDAKPKNVLSLDSAAAEAVATWAPVKQTLNQFIDEYHKMGDMVTQRMARLAGL